MPEGSPPPISFPQLLPGLAETSNHVLNRGIGAVREVFGLTMALYLLVVIFPGSEIPLFQKLSAYVYVFFAAIATYQSRTNLHHSAMIGHLAGFTVFALGNSAYSYLVSHNLLLAVFWAVWLPGIYVERAMVRVPKTGIRYLLTPLCLLVVAVAGYLGWSTLTTPGLVAGDLFLLIPIAHVGSLNLVYLLAAAGDHCARSFAGHRAQRMKQQEETERRLNAELAATQQQLERLNRSLSMSALAASIAHEISQPLASVVTNTGAALRWLDSERMAVAEARQALGRVVADGHRASAVISTFRSMLSQGAPKRVSLNLRELADEALDILAPEIHKNGITVLKPFAPALPTIHGDRVQLRQVILNLLANAIEAMTEVVEPRLLIVRYGRDDHGRAILCIEDSGVGLATSDPERVFEAYFTTKPEGMGMGLFISRMMAEAHGGSLRVDSRPGRTRFYLSIPVENLHA